VSDGGNRDLVVFDDLLFGEPRAFRDQTESRRQRARHDRSPCRAPPAAGRPWGSRTPPQPLN
jgi:hypothetical protein